MGRRLDLWLPSYLLGTAARARARRQRRDKTTHVFFLICDHYEPRHKTSREGQAQQRVETWQREYPLFQQRCRDAFGHAPLHTWFYPPHHGAEHLPRLAEMAHAGGGEVELHYHHNNDTAETRSSCSCAAHATPQSASAMPPVSPSSRHNRRRSS